MLLGLITSEIKMSRSQISSNELLINFQEGLRNLLAGTIIPCEQRPNPSLSRVRFVPSIAHISLSGEWVGGNSVTGGVSTVARPPFLPLPLWGPFCALSTFWPPLFLTCLLRLNV